MKLKNLIKKYKNYNIFFIIFIIMLGFCIVLSPNFNESFRGKKKKVKSKMTTSKKKRCHDPQLCDLNKTKLYKCEENDIITANSNMKKVKICKKNNLKFKTQSSANKNIRSINCHEDIDPIIYDKNKFLIYECAQDNTEINNLKQKGWDLDFTMKEYRESKCLVM